jgi:hypothetical protein
MKSSFELAMERLAKSDPAASAPVSPAQKARLAEIDRTYQGRMAEREIFLKQQLEQALAAQKADEIEQLRKQLVSERARLEDERDAEKDAVRKGRT